MGGNAIEYLTVWLSHCQSVCLSGQLTCNSINIHNRNNNNNYDSGCYLEPSADTHFRGKPLPFLHRAAPIYCLYCCLSFMCFCVSTVCLAATCSPQAKILVLTNPLPSPHPSLLVAYVDPRAHFMFNCSRK